MHCWPFRAAAKAPVGKDQLLTEDSCHGLWKLGHRVQDQRGLKIILKSLKDPQEAAFLEAETGGPAGNAASHFFYS